MFILRVLCYNSSLVIRTILSLTSTKFNPLVFFAFLLFFSSSSYFFWTTSPRYIFLARTVQKASPSLLHVLSLPRKRVPYTELFTSNGCCTVGCLHSCYLSIGLYVTILWLSGLVAALFSPSLLCKNGDSYEKQTMYAKLLFSGMWRRVTGRNLMTLRRNILPPSSWWKSKPGNQIAACLDNCPALKAEVVRSYVMSVSLYQTTRGHTPEDCSLHSYRCE
jgi:hypothetical protein